MEVNDLQLGKDVTFRLYAFTFGTSGGQGHCVAYVRRKSGKWYLCDDCKIMELQESDVPLTESAFRKKSMAPINLFYLRVE